MDSGTQQDVTIFDDVHDSSAISRSNMIPKWIRFFCWVFVIFSPLGIIVSIVALIWNLDSSLSLYGFTTYGTNFLYSAISFGVMVLNGTTAFGLLTERDWAVKLAIADAIVGILLCILSYVAAAGVVSPGISVGFHLRLEILLLIPFLVRMVRIRHDWEENRFARRLHISGQ